MTANAEELITPTSVMEVLSRHPGREAGLSVVDLVEVITGAKTTKPQERAVRTAITELRKQGYPACASPTDGYFWGVTPDEVMCTARALTRRSFTSLTLASRMTGRSVVELTEIIQREIEAENNG